MTLQRKTISFDVDGVISGMGYIEPEDRTNDNYNAMVPVPEAISSLKWLAVMYDIYLSTARGHENANLGLRYWLHSQGLGMDTIAGVIVNPYWEPHMNKTRSVRAINSILHIDDHPRHVEEIQKIGIDAVLFKSDMPESIAASGVYPTLYSWADVREFLSTPGLQLHGSNGVTVVSPAEE